MVLQNPENNHEYTEQNNFINDYIKKHRTVTFSYLMMIRSLQEELNASVRQIQEHHINRRQHQEKWWKIWKRLTSCSSKHHQN